MNWEEKKIKENLKTATEVAREWAGVVMKKKLTKHLSRSGNAEKAKIAEEAKCYRPTDRTTDIVDCRVACTRLKKDRKLKLINTKRK